MSTNDRTLAEHEAVLPLLPWWSNGTLSEEERERVDLHLAECPLCRQEAECSQALGEAIRGLAPLAPSPHPRELDRLWARVELSEAVERGRQPWRRLGRRAVELLSETPRPVRWSLLAQAAALLVLAGLMLAPRPGSIPATFRTLSEAPADAGSGPRLRLLFAETATEGEIRRLLQPLQARIVDGPSPLGVYTVELPRASDPLAVVVEHLRSQAPVRFVEPVSAGSVR